MLDVFHTMTLLLYEVLIQQLCILVDHKTRHF